MYIECNLIPQNYLPLDTITKEIFTQWMELIRQIVDRPVPEVGLQFYLMSRIERKPVFGVSNQVRHKPDCTTQKMVRGLKFWI